MDNASERYSRALQYGADVTLGGVTHYCYKGYEQYEAKEVKTEKPKEQ